MPGPCRPAAPDARKAAGKGALAARAIPGATFEVTARPGGRRDAVTEGEGPLRVETTEPAEGGRATAAVARQLARALGVAPLRLTLLRGRAARTKVFRLD
ncbi:DUF167 domain-containing protein [Wenxinia saemankumensis]|uniref:DUF167 domain-containing protein n=1 Tax=Wenxinia saemankumensis TaxID=1447782 RepID=UPI0009325A42|nr:DUF167 domain-containing protein [Wenxinia saemankumensis]